MNKTLKILISIFVMTGIFLPVASVAQAQSAPRIIITQIDTAHFPSVTVYVSVVDANGNPYPVDPSKIAISENGIPVKAENVQGIGTVQKLTALLVIDTSGSMALEGKLDGAKEAANQFVDRMRSGDQAGILAFNITATLVAPITSDTAQLKAAIASLTARENTALYDALIQAEDILAPVEGRKAIIALTDGLDNRSTRTPTEVIGNIAASGLSISIIGLGDPTLGVNNVNALDEPALVNLASEAGGIYSYAQDPAGLSALYRSLQRNLQAEYAITYLSSVPLRDGVNRALTVSLSASGSSNPVSSQGKYNPGGLIPEVGKAAPWSVFAEIGLGLILVMFIPSLVRWIIQISKPKKKKPVIKLLD
jgi:Ca-activated chloride channel homolog